MDNPLTELQYDEIAERAVLNRAGVVDHIECDFCDEAYVFSMQKGEEPFLLGLTTVLACLAFAEHEGCVPKLPDDWWLDVSNVYK